MKNLRQKVKRHFMDPDDTIIDELSKIDLKYIDEYMNRKSSSKKITRVVMDEDRLDIFKDEEGGITYFRKI